MNPLSFATWEKARSPNGLACAKIQEHTTLFNRAKIVWKNQRFGLFKKNASSDFFCFSKGFSHGFFPFSSFDPCHGDWGTRLGRSRHAKAQFLDGVMENPEKCTGGPAL
jgi:hypothetical protein